MKKIITLLLGLSLSLLATDIKIDDAYVRATPPGLPNSASFMSITNTSSQDISLQSVSSSISKVVELHTHDMKDGKMMMYQVPKIDIKANSITVLKPGGLHIMLIGLKQKPLKAGETIDLNLHFSNGQTVALEIPIKTVMGGMMKHKMKHNMKQGSCGQGKCGK